MSYNELLEIIECRWDEMQTKETFMEYITIKGLEVIKSHIKEHSAEVIHKYYTDDDYIFEFLVKCCMISLDKRDFLEAKKYTEILFNLYEEK